jgi:hypothetical protein
MTSRARALEPMLYTVDSVTGPKTGISDVGDSYPRGMTSSGSISATFIAAMVFATVA